MNHEKAVRVYMAIKAKKADLKKAYDAEVATLDGQLELIENALLGSLIENKVSSMRTDAGTFYKELVIKPTCADWDIYHNWIAEERAFEGLEKRVGKTFIVDYLRDNKDTPPPGITVFKEHVARIRSK